MSFSPRSTPLVAGTPAPDTGPGRSVLDAYDRGTVIILSHNHKSRLLQTLRTLMQSEEGWPVIVVDNGSTDGTSKAVRKEFPRVLLIRSRRDIGAAARNIAVAYAHTAYVAFCDDDMQWQPGALRRAAEILDQHPTIAVISACIRVGDAGAVSPACQAMARSPLPQEHLPGPQMLGFLPNACVMRTRAFYEVGGVWPPLHEGGEDILMALDLAERGWHMVYVEEVALRQQDLRARHNTRLQRQLMRNAIWVAWMRLPLPQAWSETLSQLKVATARGQLKTVVSQVLAGLLSVWHRRHVISPSVVALRDTFFAHEARTQETASRRQESYMT
jgi:GT2 family glycosyltransferase